MTEQKLVFDLQCTHEKAVALAAWISNQGYSLSVKQNGDRFQFAAARLPNVTVTEEQLIGVVADHFGLTTEQAQAALQAVGEARH